jgi:hypothetical protein
MERQALRASFIHTSDVFYSDTRKDGYGGVQIVWVQKYWGIKCRLYGMTGRFTITEGGIEYPVVKKMMCEDTVIVSKGDKIASYDDENYIVLQSDVVCGLRAHHRELLLGRLEA